MAVSDHISLFILTIGRNQSRSTVHACVRVFSIKESVTEVCACVSHFECGASGLLFGKMQISFIYIPSLFIAAGKASE